MASKVEKLETEVEAEVKVVEKAVAVIPAKVPDRLAALHAEVERWFVATFHNRGLLDAEARRLLEAKQTLKEALSRLV